MNKFFIKIQNKKKDQDHNKDKLYRLQNKDKLSQGPDQNNLNSKTTNVPIRISRRRGSL